MTLFKAVDLRLKAETRKATLSLFKRLDINFLVRLPFISFSRWHIYTENPFKNGPPPVEISWMPEGSREREYATFVFKERFAREARRCIGPYVCKLSSDLSKDDGGLIQLMMRTFFLRACYLRYPSRISKTWRLLLDDAVGH